MEGLDSIRLAFSVIDTSALLYVVYWLATMRENLRNIDMRLKRMEGKYYG